MDFTENHFALSSSAVPEVPGRDNEDLYSFLFQGSEITSTSSEQQQLSTKAETYPAPMLLPSSSFSYRQLSPDRPPKMPSFNQTLPPLQPVIASVNVSAPVPATATLSASSESPSADADIWLHRFQQLQQLQQQHHIQQHQLLSSTLLATSDLSSKTADTTASTTSSTTSHRNSSSERSVSPASSSSQKGDKDAIYPSPPLQDDMDMDSDSEDHAQELLNPTPTQLKKMTPKERRQLRNKLSARNFRVRRKEYIGTLEAQVKEARKEAADLQRRLIQSELNCQFLRQELETARLSQSLFTDGRMSKEHANLLASLLNPLTESFPTTSTSLVNNSSATSSSSSSSSNGSSSSQAPVTAAIPIAPSSYATQEPLSYLDSSLLDNNQPFELNNASLASQFALTPTSATDANAPQASMQPFVPFEGDWNLLINRAEVPDSTLDPKEESSEAVDDYKNLLSRYEAARQEEELDEQMRTELKAHSKKRLEEMYMISPKNDALVVVDQKSQEELLMFQGLVYVMMLHLTSSLFQAATMSNTELVNMYQTMDGPLRQKMILGQQEQNRYEPGSVCYRWVAWREGWIRKHWPSFYNNRRRLCELFEIGAAACGAPNICSGGKNKNCQKSQQELDSVEVARKMEEGVKGKTVEVQKVSWFVRNYLPTMFKCPEILERERLEDEARAHSRSQRQKLADALAKVAASNVTPVA
ncbi:hypothetical protein EMPS_00234 [Entomortierella parvispora]|uniref:BZIP domain-containing protein n=1 Tax=Entomortierella parvispora TaxID=205924 RepID=A0A9P3H1C2_9FUNG|nr:hypothetical protein EMPS_00234 [Entomortierella parvispora]